MHALPQPSFPDDFRQHLFAWAERNSPRRSYHTLLCDARNPKLHRNCLRAMGDRNDLPALSAAYCLAPDRFAYLVPELVDAAQLETVLWSHARHFAAVATPVSPPPRASKATGRVVGEVAA